MTLSFVLVSRLWRSSAQPASLCRDHMTDLLSRGRNLHFIGRIFLIARVAIGWLIIRRPGKVKRNTVACVFPAFLTRILTPLVFLVVGSIIDSGDRESVYDGISLDSAYIIAVLLFTSTLSTSVPTNTLHQTTKHTSLNFVKHQKDLLRIGRFHISTPPFHISSQPPKTYNTPKVSNN